MFFGIIGPIAIGGLIASFSLELGILKWVIRVAGAISVAQLMWSAWALVDRWDEKYERALDSALNNNELFNLFEELAKQDPPDIKARYALLNERNRIQEISDCKDEMTSYERRFAMRSALIQFRRTCVVCNDAPRSMKSKNKCDTCGNLKEK